MAKPVSFKRSRRSFIWNYIIGIGLLFYLVLSGAILTLSLIWIYFFIALILIFFLEPEGILVYRYYLIEPDSVSEVKGILIKKKIAIPYRSIADERLKKGIIGRMLNFGDIIITGFKNEINFKGVKNPEKVYKMIEKKFAQYRESGER